MSDWARCGGGCGALAQNAAMLGEGQECLRQSDLDSSVSLLVGPKSSRLMFRLVPRASEPGQKLPAGIFLPFLPSAELPNSWPLVEKNAGWEEGAIRRKPYPDVCVRKLTQDRNHASHRTLSFSGYASKTRSGSTKHVCVNIWELKGGRLKPPGGSSPGRKSVKPVGGVTELLTSSSSFWVSASIFLMSSMVSSTHLSMVQKSCRWKLVKILLSCCGGQGGV